MNIICDSFADCPRTECETGAIRTYTKSNMKPTKRVLQNVTTATKILRKCVKTLLRITEQKEKLIMNILSNVPVGATILAKIH